MDSLEAFAFFPVADAYSGSHARLAKRDGTRRKTEARMSQASVPGLAPCREGNKLHAPRHSGGRWQGVTDVLGSNSNIRDPLS